MYILWPKGTDAQVRMHSFGVDRADKDMKTMRCPKLSPDGLFRCTRPSGHLALHAAIDGDLWMAEWFDHDDDEAMMVLDPDDREMDRPAVIAVPLSLSP